MNVKDKDIFEYSCSDDTGDAHVVVYRLFPGVEVAYISAHMGEFDFALVEKEYRHRYVGIHFCKEGRIEQEVDNEFFYLMPDDCCVVIQDRKEKKFKLPLKHYHGINIEIDTELAPKKFSEYLDSTLMDPQRIAERLCGDNRTVVLRSIEPVKHIFSESYAVPESKRKDYLKIKLLELLFVLNQVDISEYRYIDYSVPRAQAELVKKVAEYISENLNDKLSLNTLTATFGVSSTYLQKSFKAVYGMSVASFIRTQKMQKAAQQLIHTNRNIDDIAEEFGYINESKFSAVFKKLMGDSPSVFRKEHSKIKIV